MVKSSPSTIRPVYRSQSSSKNFFTGLYMDGLYKFSLSRITVDKIFTDITSADALEILADLEQVF